MQPIIGITCSWQEDRQSHCLGDYYVQAVQAAGGIPLIIPSLELEAAEAVYERIDGLLLAGGPDLDPQFFGEEAHKGLGEITPKRDCLELELCRLALRGKKPLLGICRGIQVINVAAGGTLHQDLAGITEQKHSQKAPRWYPTHQVEILENSKLYYLAQAKTYQVNSFHHQAIKILGEGLKAVAWSGDGLVEAVEGTSSGSEVMGVQWHPEGTWNQDQLSHNLFCSLLEATVRS